MSKKLYHTTYLVAANWCHNHRVLCNNLPKIDQSVWDNMPTPPNIDADEDDEDDFYDDMPEIFQWFITDCSKSDADYLTETFGLLFTYSNLLNCYVLCVTHYGTSWDYVDWSTTNPNAERKCGESK